MQVLSWKQWSVIGAAIVLFVLLFFADKKLLPKKQEAKPEMAASEKIDTQNLSIDSLISLAVSYVQGPSPMQGITLLREAEKRDSNNTKVQMYLGAFAMQSQQYEKAINRFNKILKIDSTKVEMYLSMAEAYKAMGNKEQELESLKKYVQRSGDEKTREEVQDYINKLK